MISDDAFTQTQAHQQIEAAFMGFGSGVLTVREREIAHLMLRGHSVKSTAQVLGISPETVRMHRKNLYTKLAINSRTELFALFYRMADPQRCHRPFLSRSGNRRELCQEITT